jgi:hypothetical protein
VKSISSHSIKRSGNGLFTQIGMPKRQPVIQFWEMGDAPDYIRTALPPGQIFDWVAVVPPELQNREVLSLLTNGPGVDSLCRCDLQNGDCLLAGRSSSAFDPAALLVAGATTEVEPSKSRSATAGIHGRGSATRS